MMFYKIKGYSQKKNSLKPQKKKSKKKIKPLSECNICFNKVELCRDNTITCGKVNHTICGECKVHMKGDNCPMCRSHPVKQPIAQDINLKIIKKNKKGITHPVAPYIMNPKKRRYFRRNNPYYEEFGFNTNRLVRQRSSRTGRTNMIQNRWSNREVPPIEQRNNTWLSQEDVLRYNGSLRTEYDSVSDTSEDTLSLTEWTSVDEANDEIHIPRVEYDNDNDSEYGEVVEYILGINHN